MSDNTYMGGSPYVYVHAHKGIHFTNFCILKGISKSLDRLAKGCFCPQSLYIQGWPTGISAEAPILDCN